jgi:hypothetical protein
MSDDNVTEWESGKPETPCGRGSKFEETEIIRAWLPEIVDAYEIESINDVGCGDQNWIHEIEWPHEIKYSGFDVQPRAADVVPLDITMEVLPKADLVLCVYVLNHLRPKAMQRALGLMQESGSRYLLSSYNTVDKINLEMLGSIAHKETPRHTWRYGLWKLQDEK